MRLTKKVLKTLVKECLIEVLSEGMTVSSKKSKNEFDQVVSEVATPKRKTADLIKFQSRVKETSQSLTEDPVLGAIFEDTAMTTLQEQTGRNEKISANDRASYAAATSDPSDLFGESADKWASLAFFDDKK